MWNFVVTRDLPPLVSIKIHGMRRGASPTNHAAPQQKRSPPMGGLLLMHGLGEIRWDPIAIAAIVGATHRDGDELCACGVAD